MITAVDSAILIDIVGADATFGRASLTALSDAQMAGGVVASEVVWSEAGAGFEELEAFRGAMDDMGVRFSALSVESAETAGRAWRAYRAGGGPRTRIISDFLVGAHALIQADRLLTRDRGFYRRYFSDLVLVDPSG